MRRVTGVLLVAVVLSLTGATLLAHEVTYKGTVIAVEATKVQVKVIDEKSKKETPMDFAITTETKVFRGDKPVPFADAHIQKDERIAVTVNHDEPGHEALVIRLAARQ
jgi:hypothetical protein